MPWSKTSPMKERIRFVADFQRGLFSTSELYDRYHISRKTGYKWLDRFEQLGPSGLEDRSRKPLNCPHKTHDLIFLLYFSQLPTSCQFCGPLI